MEADENLKSLLTSAGTLTSLPNRARTPKRRRRPSPRSTFSVSVSGKKAEGKIAMVLHDGNGYYYVAVLTYGSGSGGFGSGSNGGGTTSRYW